MSICLGYCPECDAVVTAEPRPVSHLLHLFLTLVTGGLWLIVWIAVTLSPAANCHECGTEVASTKMAYAAGRWWQLARWTIYALILGPVGLVILYVLILGLVKKLS